MLANEARKRGAKIVVIDVHRNDTAKWADDFYQILPGSGGALALGIAHIVMRDGPPNPKWTEKHVIGLEEFSRQANPPAKVAKLTGLLKISFRF